MKTKGNSIKQNFYNQISKTGLLENDKRLVIKNLGLNNLSHSNINEEKSSLNNNSFITNSLSTIKIENRKQKSSIKICLTKNEKLKNILKKYSTNDNTRNKCIIKNYKNSSETLSKNSLKKHLLCKNNKSMAVLPIKPNISINSITNYSLGKINKVLYEGRNHNNISSYGTTTAQNSLKTQNMNSNKDLLGISPEIKPISKKKNKNKINENSDNSSNQNLLIYKKEKPYKLFDNNILNKSSDKYTINSPDKKKVSNRNKSSKKKNEKVDTKKNEKMNSKKSIKNIISSLEKICDENRKENEEKKKYTVTDNSEDTRKESCIDIQKIFNEKVLNNIEKRNFLGNLSNNMDIYLREDNININNESLNPKVIKVTGNNTIREKLDENDDTHKYIATQKISLTHVDSKVKKELNKIIEKDSNDSNRGSLDNNNFNFEEDEKEEKIRHNNHNDLNYTDIENENNNNTSEYQNNNNEFENSSIQTHRNIYKKLADLNNIQEMNKQEEQEIMGDQDNKSGQTQTTFDKNNIIYRFIKHPIYNVSPRFLNEVSLNKVHILPNKSFAFINEIEQENKKFPVINIKKILNLNEKCIYNLLRFTYDNYSSIISVHKLVKNKINNSLKKIFQKIIEDFKFKYSKFLKVIDFSFNQQKIPIKNKESQILNMEIKCQIITKEVKKSYEIGCNYISDKKKYDYIWKFDVQNKNDIKLWLCTELDKINNSYKKFTYTSQVTSFSYLDEIILQLNIFSKGNIIEPGSIEWTDPIESYAITGVYENSEFISSIPFDQLRACEVETQILFWKKTLPDDDGGIINDFKKIFEKYFKIKEIYFDKSKFYFFKIVMEANKIGLLKQNKFSSFDINIIDSKSNTKNAIQCIFLMNSNYNNKIMDIRLGTGVTLYIIDMKR